MSTITSTSTTKDGLCQLSLSDGATITVQPSKLEPEYLRTNGNVGLWVDDLVGQDITMAGELSDGGHLVGIIPNDEEHGLG